MRSKHLSLWFAWIVPALLFVADTSTVMWGVVIGFVSMHVIRTINVQDFGRDYWKKNRAGDV